MNSTLSPRGPDSLVRAQTRTPTDKGAGLSKRSVSNASASIALSHSSPKMPSHSRSKTTSHIDVLHQGKRLSLQFPIQLAAGSNSPNNSPPSRPQSWIGASSPSVMPDAAPSPSETNILAVLAAQERFVFELKEELNKAEVDLKTLKRYYAQHEAHKLRSEQGKVAQLRPLNTSLANAKAHQDDEVGSNLWMQREMERRKALLSSTKTSQRKVFSGSRHLRTLSLLSPENTYSPSFPQPLDLLSDEPIEQQRSLLVRSSTSPDARRQVADDANDERYDMGGMPTIQREKIIRAGTQMATDFKNGLFTFIEDIRQATVGDEATNGADGDPASTSVKGLSTKSARKASDGRPSLNRSASSKKPGPRSGSVGDDFWKENGLSESKTTTMNKKNHAMKNAQTPQKQISKPADEDEGWDNWDTPNDAYVGKGADNQNSSDESDGATSSASGPGSSRTSTSSLGISDDVVLRDSKPNSLPWPDLVKLSPTNLKRTASHLMKEWEKQLTPPPESRTANHSHGDYIGRSSSPPSLMD